jgi:hypothetical protein
VRRRFLFGVRGAERRFAVRQQGKIQQAVGVVVGGAKQLAAGNIFIHRRNAALQAHLRRVDRFADRQLRQRGAVGAQQEDGFDVIAAGLLERQRRQLAVGDAAFGHHPVDGQIQLLFNLGDAQLGKLFIAPSSVRLQAWAAAIAFSPPLTATYISTPPRGWSAGSPAGARRRSGSGQCPAGTGAGARSARE